MTPPESQVFARNYTELLWLLRMDKAGVNNMGQLDQQKAKKSQTRSIWTLPQKRLAVSRGKSTTLHN